MGKTIRKRTIYRWSRSSKYSRSVFIDKEVAEATLSYDKHVFYAKLRNKEAMSKEDYIAWCVDSSLDYYDKMTRDGYTSESGRSKFFKKLNTKVIRNKSRVELQKYQKEEHEDYRVYDDKDGKKFIWTVW